MLKMGGKNCPKASAGILSLIFFGWFDSVAWKGFRRPLTPTDLWHLEEENEAGNIVSKFEAAWVCEKERKVGGKVSIFPVLFKAFGLYYAIGSAITVVPHLLDLLAPVFLSKIIDFVRNGEGNWEGCGWAMGLFTASMIALLFKAHVSFIFRLTGLRVKTALMNAVYRKSLVLSRSGNSVSSTGEIMNLVSVDVQKVLDIIPYMYQVWVFPLQISIALCLLWSYMGLATLAGMAVILALIPVNAIVGTLAKKYQKSQMRNKDERVKLLNAIIMGMKILKFHAWEEPFGDKVAVKRSKEMASLTKAACLTSMHEFLSFGSQFLVALATFAAYVALDEKNVLDAKNMFTTLALLNVIAFPMKQLPITTILAVKAAVSMKRLNKFLNSEELDASTVSTTAIDGRAAPGQLNLTNCSFNWKHDDPPILTDISLTVSPGELVAIVGAVGSGKSSLLSGILGEMEKTGGKLSRLGTVSYVPQQAWIQNATVQSNILFGRAMDCQWYEATKRACCLLEDLKNLEDGDKTLIGEKGINLSGGQKQRISVARAVYSQADIYLLDDPLSAVDAHVGADIFNNVIGPKGLLKNKTRILVTHGVQYLSQADRIVVLKHGKVSEVGSYRELIQAGSDFSKFQDEYGMRASAVVEEKPKRFSRQFSNMSNGGEAVPGQETEGEAEVSALMGGVDDSEGMMTIPCSLYLKYLRAGGYGIMIGSFIMYFVYQAFELGGKIWMSVWSSEADLDKLGNSSAESKGVLSRFTVALNATGYESSFYLHVYAGIGLLQSLSILSAAIMLSLGALRASSRLHTAMLRSVLRAPMSFFDVTPSGRLTNGFVKDIDILDTTVAPTLRLWMTDFVMVCATLFIIVCTMPLFALISIPGIAIFYGIQKLYVPTARQLMRLEAKSRSPIYSHFNESLCGVSTIRAYGHEQRFVREAMERIDQNQRPYFMVLVAERWLAIRLEGIASLIKLTVALLVVIYRGELSEAAVGLALTYAMDVTYNLGRLIRSYCDIETNIVAVERVERLCCIPKEGDWESQTKPPSDWPSGGSVEFQKYSARYSDDLPPALEDINCSICAGEKVGVVGRTGAGKSSLALTLFRILEAASGSIVIDGVDISQVGLHDLRSKLAIIPQDPTLFSGTLRFNLDPSEKHSDDEIWRALELAHLKPFVRQLPGRLEEKMAEEGGNLSVGQKQLVCLARALLQRSKILILDEATATVDLETDKLIQATIRQEFKDSTVITIAHRLNTVLDSDRIMVLQAGKIIEFDHPRLLLLDQNSEFYRLAKEAGLAHISNFSIPE